MELPRDFKDSMAFVFRSAMIVFFGKLTNGTQEIAQQ